MRVLLPLKKSSNPYSDNDSSSHSDDDSSTCSTATGCCSDFDDDNNDDDEPNKSVAGAETELASTSEVPITTESNSSEGKSIPPLEETAAQLSSTADAAPEEEKRPAEFVAGESRKEHDTAEKKEEAKEEPVETLTQVEAFVARAPSPPKNVVRNRKKPSVTTRSSVPSQPTNTYSESASASSTYSFSATENKPINSSTYAATPSLFSTAYGYPGEPAFCAPASVAKVSGVASCSAGSSLVGIRSSETGAFSSFASFPASASVAAAAASSSSNKKPAALPYPAKKRPRIDSKPAAKPTTRSSSKMAGPRRQPLPAGYKQDDSDRLVNPNNVVVSGIEMEVLENEPQVDNYGYRMNSPGIITNSSSLVTALPSPDAAASADDDRVECESDAEFRQALKARGLEIVEQEGDGNCLFRAVSLQVYGDSSMHGEVRERCLDFMARDQEHFGQFVTGEPFAAYLARKRQDGVHGNNPEIQAISELFNRPVEVFTPETGANPLNIFHAEYKTGDAPIRLSYHDGNHYNAVIDPLVPTAGLGLGMPGLQPGLADKMQVAKAISESDQLADDMELQRALKESQEDELQRALKESTYSRENLYQSKALVLSDLDATNFELEQAALVSSLESYSRQEQGRKQRASPSNNNNNQSSRQQRRLRGRNSPSAGAASMPTFADSSTEAAAIPAAASLAPPSPPRVASAAAAAASDSTAAYPPLLGSVDEYPQTVQELVMNGFELAKVVHAYELIGDNFDDLLCFLMSTGGGKS